MRRKRLFHHRFALITLDIFALSFCADLIFACCSQQSKAVDQIVKKKSSGERYSNKSGNVSQTTQKGWDNLLSRESPSRSSRPDSLADSSTRSKPLPTEEDNRQKCATLMREHSVVLGSSWGSLDMAQQK